MTPTEKARRSDALHQGPDTRRVLCDMIANRESDLEDARAENEKLREENERLKLFANGDAIITDYWKDEDGTMHVLTTDGSSTFEYMRGGLAEENAKLREMVRFVLVLRHDPVYKWLDATTAEVCGKSFTEQARELGMEMDE